MCHGLNVAMRLRRINPKIREMPSLQCFIAFMVGSIGGGTTAGVVLGVPPKSFGVFYYTFATAFNNRNLH